MKFSKPSSSAFLIKIISTLFFFSAVFFCRKLKDVEAIPENSITQKFFQVPEDASHALISVINDIKKQNDKHNFVNQLTGKYGYPEWDKSAANVPVKNNTNSPNFRNATGDSLQVFLIPFRATDSSVSSYLTCARNGDEFTYRYYKKDNLSSLYAANDTIKFLRSGLLSVFGHFEKNINNKDSIYIAGNYEKRIKDVSISFNERHGSGRSQINDPITLLTVCYKEDGPIQRTSSQGVRICITVGVYGSLLDMGFTSSGGYSSGGGGGGGGSTGSNSFPDGFQCPQSEWWCESGEYRFVNGILYTPLAYPGQMNGLSWLWWENNSGTIPSSVHLNNMMALINTLNPTNSQANWLASHSSEANDLYQSIDDYMNLDPISPDVFPTVPANEIITTTKITIDAAINNLINGSYNINHLNSIIIPYFPNQQANATIIDPKYWAYFALQCVLIKAEHPGWSNIRVYWAATSETIHILLDGAGMIPVIGEIADLANGIIYTIEGDGVNAVLSFSATIPIVGWGPTVAKYAKKAITALDGSTRTLKWLKRTDGTIDFGDRSLLRKVLGLEKGDSKAAHHIIPWAKADHRAVQKAAQGGTNSFHLNEIFNGIPLNKSVHTGSHAAYSRRVQARLDAIPTNLSIEQTRNAIEQIVNDIKTQMLNNPNTHIDNLIF
jgi:hypothetical protein